MAISSPSYGTRFFRLVCSMVLSTVAFSVLEPFLAAPLAVAFVPIAQILLLGPSGAHHLAEMLLVWLMCSSAWRMAKDDKFWAALRPNWRDAACWD